MRDRNRNVSEPGTPRARSGFAFPPILLLSALLALAGAMASGLAEIASAQKIRELESDTLQTRSEERRHRIIIHSDEDSASTTIRIGRSRWKRHGGESSSLVRFGETIVIEADEVVDGSVVSIAGDVVVRGRVLEDVVSLGGSVSLEEGAVVEGDAAAFGGEIDRHPGSELLGEEVDVAFVPSVLGGPFHGPVVGRSFWALFSLSLYVFLGLAALATEWVMPVRLRHMALYVGSALWPSFFVGLAAQVLFGPIFLLLCVTVIGIPVALLLPLVFAVAQVIGFLIVAAVIGSKLADGSIASRAAWVRSVLVGLAGFAFFTLFAVLLAGLGGFAGSLGRLFVLATLAALWTVTTLGLGAVLLSRFGSRTPSGTPGMRSEGPIGDSLTEAPRPV